MLWRSWNQKMPRSFSGKCREKRWQSYVNNVSKQVTGYLLVAGIKSVAGSFEIACTVT